MKKFIALGALVVGIVVLVFASIAAAQSSPDQNSNSGQGQSPSSSGQADPAQTTNLTVSIHDHAFDPSELSVAPKTTVTWVNNDTVAHTATADDGLFDSGVLQPGESYSVWFNGAGQVAYHCTIHPDMKGSLVVGGASGGEPTTAGGQTTSPKQEATAPAPEQTTSTPEQTTSTPEQTTSTPEQTTSTPEQTTPQQSY